MKWKDIARENDPLAFIDILSTVSVSGLWLDPDRQADIKKGKVKIDAGNSN